MVYGGAGTPYAAPYMTGGYYQGGAYQGAPYVAPGQAAPGARESVPAGTGAPAPAPKKAKTPVPLPGNEEETTPPPQAQGAAPATIIVSLPADARLSFDGTPTQSTSALRVFASPPLTPGRTFAYTLTAQIMRDGRPAQMSRQVNVRAGQTTNVALTFPTADATASR
jgi:uncharacterized protein (TIGR03000 family)